MAEKTREWSVPQIAAFLFAAVLKLARVCDGARALDGSGFNKFDAERGHRFADEDPESWDADKCSYVRRLLWKYRVQLLDNHGIDISGVPDALQLDMAKRTLGFERGYGGQFVLAWDYNDPQFGEIKDAVKALDQRRYQGGTKVWVVPVELSSEVAKLVQHFGFEISDSAKLVIEGETELAPRPNIRGGVGYGNFVFEFPYDPDMLNDLKSTFSVRRWDRDNRVWIVNAESISEVNAVIDFSRRYKLTVSDDARGKCKEVVEQVGKDLRSDGKAKKVPESTQEPPSDDDLYGESGREPEPQEDIEDYHKRTEMGRNWKASDAAKLFE